jgi:hypothetical protein
MITLGVRIEGFSALSASLGSQARQVPFAASLAINRTAQRVREETLVEMSAQFDRPTPLVMKSLFITPATKARLQAAVYLKDREIGGKNSRSMAEILGHQFAGGTRLRKRMEDAFTGAGLIGLGEYLVPGPDAKLDQYGNLSRGQTQQIYAALRLFRDPYQNATQSKRSLRNAKAAGRMFWSDGKGANKVRRGLWADRCARLPEAADAGDSARRSIAGGSTWTGFPARWSRASSTGCLTRRCRRRWRARASWLNRSRGDPIGSTNASLARIAIGNGLARFRRLLAAWKRILRGTTTCDSLT